MLERTEKGIEKHRLTVYISVELLEWVRHRALDKGVTLSKYVSDFMAADRKLHKDMSDWREAERKLHEEGCE